MKQPVGMPAMPPGMALPPMPKPPAMTPELKEKFEELKGKITKFKDKLLKKYDKMIVGVALLPPPKPLPGRELPTEQKGKHHVLVLLDETQTKIPPREFQTKVFDAIDKLAQETDKELLPQSLLLRELWQNCYDGKTELLELIALGMPVHDKGMLNAIRIAEVHKRMALEKFERYIVAYVLAGSLVQGKATDKSDIDVFIVVDDTDVKKMTRWELRDKLRNIIISMGMQAAEVTGVRNKLNVQVYIMTDFWESIKEANPVIFTFLRDGVPFFDRGIFMPWKLLLKMGRIKPSPEAIDQYMSSGEQSLDRVRTRLKEIGIEDFFWSILTPSQASLMLYGLPPPTPKDTPRLMREIFVEKEKILREKDVKVLENSIKLRKDLEHGEKKQVTGTEIDKMLNDCRGYLEQIRKLFGSIEKLKEKESIGTLHDEVVTTIRDILSQQGVASVQEEDIVEHFEHHLTNTGKVPAKYARILQDLVKANKEYASMNHVQVTKIRKSGFDLHKHLVEFLQRSRGKELEKATITIKHGKKFGKIVMLGNTAFIFHDTDNKEGEISKAEIKSDGSLGPLDKATLDEYEQKLAKTAIPHKVFLKAPIFKGLERIFGKDIEVLVKS